jgi:tetratricopeptide (TPR) repeat protein
MSNAKYIFSALIILAALVTGSAVLCHERGETTTHTWFKKAPAEDNEVFEKILAYRKKQDFDGAVAVANNGVNGKPPDDFLLQTISDTYFERAQQEDATKREQWVRLAVQYSERALETNPGDVVNVFNVGETYLTAAMNLQKPNGCSYYQKSLEVFERLKVEPILKGEWGTIEDERVPIQPYRQRLDEKIKEVQRLVAGCPAIANNGRS